MSLTPCVHDGRQRPVNVTCGERCERFPKCMPSASLTLKTSISHTLRAGAVERSTTAGLLMTLEATLQENGDTG